MGTAVGRGSGYRVGEPGDHRRQPLSGDEKEVHPPGPAFVVFSQALSIPFPDDHLRTRQVRVRPKEYIPAGWAANLPRYDEVSLNAIRLSGSFYATGNSQGH